MPRSLNEIVLSWLRLRTIYNWDLQCALAAFWKHKNFLNCDNNTKGVDSKQRCFISKIWTLGCSDFDFFSHFEV
jgi:hypothetical protein